MYCHERPQLVCLLLNGRRVQSCSCFRNCMRCEKRTLCFQWWFHDHHDVILFLLFLNLSRSEGLDGVCSMEGEVDVVEVNDEEGTM